MSDIRFSETYRLSHPNLGFGIGVVSEFEKGSSCSRIAVDRESCEVALGKGGDVLRQIIGKYDDFFQFHGYECPLVRQLARAREKGLPSGNIFVEALLATELSTGVLMGIQDASSIQWPIVLDIASSGESFEGMRGTVTCREEEIVLRDADGIIASYFQGPDARTAAVRKSTSLAFYGFLAPGVETTVVEVALRNVVRLFDPDFGHSRVCVHLP